MKYPNFVPIYPNYPIYPIPSMVLAPVCPHQPISKATVCMVNSRYEMQWEALNWFLESDMKPISGDKAWQGRELASLTHNAEVKDGTKHKMLSRSVTRIFPIGVA